MKDLVELLRKKLSQYSRQELDEIWQKYEEYANVGPLAEDYLLGINNFCVENNQTEMLCFQSDDYYPANCQYDMAA